MAGGKTSPIPGFLALNDHAQQKGDCRARLYGHIYAHMKTTIEIDEEKLDKIMRLSGIATRKEAVDWALTEAVRLAVMNDIEKHPWTVAEAKEAVDPEYDVLAIRHGAASAATQRKRSR